jgi:hypothetical protein
LILSNEYILLEIPCEELEISREFKSWLSKEEFENFRELLRYSAYELLLIDGFGYGYLRELYSMLEENGLEDLLKQS